MCVCKCFINYGECDKQHRCKECKGFLHAICGHEYYDDKGNVVEDLAFPRICNKCHDKKKETSITTTTTRSKQKLSAVAVAVAVPSNDKKEETSIATTTRTRSKEQKSSSVAVAVAPVAVPSNQSNITGGEDDDDSRTDTEFESANSKEESFSVKDEDEDDANSKESFSVNDEDEDEDEDDDKQDDELADELADVFDERELARFNPGFIVVNDLKRGESTIDRCLKIPDGFTSKSKVKGKIVMIPALYWGGEEGLKEDRWWKTKEYVQELRKLSYDDIKKTLLIGKVLGKGEKNCWEVSLICAKNEIALIIPKDIRNFLYKEPEPASSKSKKERQQPAPQSKAKKTKNSKGKQNSKQDDEDSTTFDDDELIEENEFESEDDLQLDDGESNEEDDDANSGSEEEEDEEVDIDFVRKEPRTSIERIWEVVDEVRSSDYSRALTESHVNCVSMHHWKDLTPWKLFELQLPEGEFELWSRFTSKNLKNKGQKEIGVDEMKLFVGCMFACTQTRKVGGITKAFEIVSDGLFPAQDLGKYGMSLRRFQYVMNCWEFADEEAEGVDTTDLYWRTEQLFDRFNNRYASIITHGSYVNVDERIFWSYARSQPGGIKVCGRKPKGTGQEAKTMSCIDMAVTTTFEHVRGNAANPYHRELQKDYGKAASVVIRLCKKAKIEGTNRIVIADSWFANLSLYRGLRKNGLHLLGMIKQGDGGFPKNGLCKLLDKDDLERGSHVTATTTIDGEKVIALAWKGKSDTGKKAKKKRKFWMSTFIASDCTTTLPGVAAEKKRHTPEGKRAQSVFVKRPKLVADYYNGMPGTDIVNRNAQFLIGLEEAVRTRDIHKRMCCTVLGTWMANAYGMAMKYLPNEMKKDMTVASFVKDVTLEGLFQTTPASTRAPISTIGNNDTESLVSTMNNSLSPSAPPPRNEVAIGMDNTLSQTYSQLVSNHAIDPYVHTLQRCADEVSGVQRQQRCVMCISENRRTMTAFYCSLCCIIANRDEERKPSKHAYCIKTEYNCFSRHIAKCYAHLNKTGGQTPQRKDIVISRMTSNDTTTSCQPRPINPLPIAGRIVSRTIPTRRPRAKRKRKQTRKKTNKKK